MMVLLDASEPRSVFGLRLVASNLPPLFYPLPLPLALLKAWVSLQLLTFHLSHFCFFTFASDMGHDKHFLSLCHRHATSQEDEMTDLDDLMLGGGDRMGNADSEGGEFTDWSR